MLCFLDHAFLAPRAKRLILIRAHTRKRRPRGTPLLSIESTSGRPKTPGAPAKAGTNSGVSKRGTHCAKHYDEPDGTRQRFWNERRSPSVRRSPSSRRARLDVRAVHLDVRAVHLDVRAVHRVRRAANCKCSGAALLSGQPGRCARHASARPGPTPADANTCHRSTHPPGRGAVTAGPRPSAAKTHNDYLPQPHPFGCHEARRAASEGSEHALTRPRGRSAPRRRPKGQQPAPGWLRPARCRRWRLRCVLLTAFTREPTGGCEPTRGR